MVAVVVRLDNNVEDDNEQREESLNVDTPESAESPLMVEIVSFTEIYHKKSRISYNIQQTTHIDE
jgi:hypothetical protein